jgi:hypothetical protein
MKIVVFIKSWLNARRVRAEQAKVLHGVSIEEAGQNPNVFIERVQERTAGLLKDNGFELRVDEFVWRRGIGVIGGKVVAFKEGASAAEIEAMETKLNEIFARYRMFPQIVRFTYYPDGDGVGIIGYRLVNDLPISKPIPHRGKMRRGMPVSMLN